MPTSLTGSAARFLLSKRAASFPAGPPPACLDGDRGEVLYIEATLLPNGRGMTLTGQLGEVMQESARAAQSYVWSHAEELGIDRDLFRKYGVHIHVPSGAIPKDGPSAGVTMATALASVYSKYPVRVDTAMTAKSRHGIVLPMGGSKKKFLAARSVRIKRGMNLDIKGHYELRTRSQGNELSSRKRLRRPAAAILTWQALGTSRLPVTTAIGQHEIISRARSDNLLSGIDFCLVFRLDRRSWRFRCLR